MGARGVRARVVAVALLLLGCSPAADPTTSDPTEAGAAGPRPPAADAPVGTTGGSAGRPGAAAAAEVLHLARPIDGDSFVADDGIEYRIGMVDTPELGTCGAEEAGDRTEALLRDGFTAEVYDRDVHGRLVARVRAVDGRDVGVALAEEGLATDRYLDDFAADNPPYAEALRTAFDRARSERRGLWASCFADRTADAAGSPQGSADQSTLGDVGGQAPVAHEGRTGRWPCHPAYVHCLPDGPDLDCAEVGHQVRLVGRDDPFRLDGNSLTATDGIGCDTYPPWDEAVTYAYEGR